MRTLSVSSRAVLVLLAQALATACSSPSAPSGADPDALQPSPQPSPSSATERSAPEPTTEPDAGVSDRSDGAASVPGGPVIRSLASDVQSVTEGQSVRFTALVTHPSGLDRLAGGRLRNMAGTITYGVFVADRQGAYALDVSWDQLHRTEPINFTSEIVRTFVGEFLDSDGHVAESRMNIRLHCGGRVACGGQCADLATDTRHCGRCSNAVPFGTDCKNGAVECRWDDQIYCGSSCISGLTETDCGACGRTCSALAASRGIPTTGGRCNTVRDCRFKIRSTSPTPLSGDSICAGHGGTCRQCSAQYQQGISESVTCSVLPQAKYSGYGAAYVASECDCDVPF